MKGQSRCRVRMADDGWIVAINGRERLVISDPVVDEELSAELCRHLAALLGP